MLPQYYEIVIKNNDFAVVSKINYDTYKSLEQNFGYIYHTKNGETYQLHKNFDAGVDIIIVDDEHLYQLLDDLRDQGFCETIEFSWIDDYFNGVYDQYKQSF